MFMKKSPVASTPAPFPYRNLRFLLWCGMLILPLLLVQNVRANVYATNLRFNGGTTNVTVPTITNIRITYILNEAATAGVTIDIKSGATLVRSISITNPNPGTLRGTNLVVWDGKDTNG